MSPPPARGKAKRKTGKTDPLILVAIISAVATIFVALLQLYPKFSHPPLPDPDSQFGTGRLEGALTDRAGNPINNVSVGILKGPETRTDLEGKFVLSQVPTGDQMIVIKTLGDKGQLMRNIRVEEGRTTKANVFYDPTSALLGLLSITAPVDDSSLSLHKEVNKDKTRYKTTIYGRCDGLAQVLGVTKNFDVWVLVSSEYDGVFCIQRPPAIVDLTSSTWQAEVYIGDQDHPPKDKERWRIVAVAADTDSQIGYITNTSKLSALPSHIRSNVITATSNF